MWDMTHSYVGHDSFICGTWLIRMWDMTHSYVGHDSWHAPWSEQAPQMHELLSDMTHTCLWHYSFICVTWLLHMCDMTLSYMGHDSLICGTGFIQMWDTTHSYVGHDMAPLYMGLMTHTQWHTPNDNDTPKDTPFSWICEPHFFRIWPFSLSGLITHT